MNIIRYMDDGASWQAQCVLAYIRAYTSTIIDTSYNTETKRNQGKIEVGRYENCREQGYVFSVRYKTEQRNYAIYEHRTSDAIDVVVFDKQTIDTPTKEEVWKAGGKNSPTKAFEWNETIECATYIKDDMISWLKARTTPLTIPEHIDAWEKETQILSNVTEIVNNRHFLEIVNAKEEAVPYIVERIKEKPSNLMWALNLIYGKKISDKPNLTITEACKLWVEEIEGNAKQQQQDTEEH